mgnify:CR=1 FL=1
MEQLDKGDTFYIQTGNECKSIIWSLSLLQIILKRVCEHLAPLATEKISTLIIIFQQILYLWGMNPFWKKAVHNIINMQ